MNMFLLVMSLLLFIILPSQLSHGTVKNASREFLLRVSYIEIYNEMIRDLLAPENNDLKILEDKHVSFHLIDLQLCNHQ